MTLDRNHKTVLQLVGVAVFMGALAWASVPLYDWFCRVTGYGGTTSVSETESDTILDQTILVRFDASLARDMPWEFRPMTQSMEIRLGETGLVFYEAYNPTDEPIAGTASYNVAPFDAGLYFSKIECFCFQQQILEPGQRVEMPVTFYVDPALIDDPEANGTPAITLSYTFHVTDIPEEYAALSGATN
ncbi:cytochrome c oxidase assembly protein [Roseobacter sp. HKCCD9010]|uniref:cytochrome c oxidase assembly protein n=2 Tax=Rhodobacterales TaxID=204455 RepID=UPI00119A5149|nr:cytochrome c oxidase assembly protein [Rhodobacterales bacterium HKCCD4356]NNV13421.1 cytochrome c oxidase assembly protein [Roseobacter sp. HKCCD7357]NNV17672.1 cytochrome c oxidase assembly protein [Roseobacter sp. HKCCD8768]NNV27278.1 cytochrome c oxidase assembly protein [Roseobacter sp. HKCCD8192]NNV31398.1 cytochrome c oxidase assembly protein [Roseobacter sp. HKCCD9061]NNV35649.1 cytochrome c oxidase assembly protein [Roseobacter sp. HKCCD9073]NNV40058.1 cytochrome c oxidase assembl